MKKLNLILKTLLLVSWFSWGAFIFYFSEFNAFKLISFLFLVGCTIFLLQITKGKAKEISYAYKIEKIYLALNTIIIFFIFCLFHYLNSKINFSIDLTHQKLHRTKSNTEKQIKSLIANSEVKMTFWGNRDHWNEYEDLLLFYKNISSKVILKWIDPNKNPEKANEVQGRKLPLLFLEYEDQRQWVDPIDEWTIGLALNGLQKKNQKVVCFFSSHQTPDISSRDADGYFEFKQFLQNNGFKIQVSTSATDEGLQHCELVILSGAKDDFLDDEIKSLNNFINQKPLIIALDPWVKDFYLKKFRSWLEKFGIESTGTPVLDQSVVQLGEEAINVLWESVTQNNNEKWNRLSDIQGRSLWQLTTGFSFNQSKKSEFDFYPVIVSKKFPSTWQENDWSEFNSGKVKYNKNLDKEGPIPLAVHVTGKNNKNNILIIGTSRLWMNGFAGFPANFQIGKVFIEYMLGEDSTNAAPVISLVEEKILLHQGQANLIFYFSIIIMPTILLLIAYWIFKKNNEE